MSGSVNSTKENLALSSFLGVVRGITVHTLIYPLEVIKIRYQCSPNNSRYIRIALELLQREGAAAFYKGLAPQLLKTSIKQIWCWPMITGVPPLLQRYNLGNLSQQVFTGLSIATVDACISTPLERAKIVSAFRGSQSQFKNFYSDGWRGFAVHWSKLSANWVAFLTAQKYLRDRSHSSSDRSLSLPQLTIIGTQVALIVSVLSAPFDIANTLKQAKNISPSQLWRYGIPTLYRGWPLNALSLIIHNIASVVLIDKIDVYQRKTRVV